MKAFRIAMGKYVQTRAAGAAKVGMIYQCYALGNEMTEIVYAGWISKTFTNVMFDGMLSVGLINRI
jgi:hypothetical protein